MSNVDNFPLHAPGQARFKDDAGPRGRLAGRVLAAVATLAVAACAGSNSQRDAIRDPDAASRLRVAFAAEASGQQDVAISMYAAAAAAAPSNADAQARYAAALGRAGMMAEAEQVLTRALQDSPREPRFLLAMAQLRVRSGAAAEALSMFDQVLASTPRNLAALNGRGIALDLMGRHADAQQSYRTAQALDAMDVPSANNLAMSLMLEGRSSEAVLILTALRQRSNAPTRVVNNLGIAQAAAGDGQSARATLAGRVQEDDLNRIVQSLGPNQTAMTYSAARDRAPEPVRTAELSPFVTPVRDAEPEPVHTPPPVVAAVPEPPAFVEPVRALPAIATPEPVRALPPIAASEQVRALPLIVDATPIPEAASAPAPVAVATPAPPPAPEPVRAIAAVMPSSSNGASGGYQVQFAALGSEAEAQRVWQAVSARHAGIIEGREPVITRFDRSGSIFYRLRLAGFSSSAEATQFCARLRAAGQACFTAGS